MIVAVCVLVAAGPQDHLLTWSSGNGEGTELRKNLIAQLLESSEFALCDGLCASKALSCVVGLFTVHIELKV